MTIEFSQIPASIRKPGAYIEFNLSLAARSLPDNRQKLLLLGQKLSTAIRPVIFSSGGGSLNDCTAGGAFTGTQRRCFVVKITDAGATDKFDWSYDGGLTWAATDVSITGSAQTLAEGVTITFGAVTGHAGDDIWTFYAEPAGTQDVLVPVQLYSAAEAAQYFGNGSTLAIMAAAALDANPYVALYAIAQADEDAGVAASGTITVTAGSASGTLKVWIGNTKYSVAVTASDTASEIAAALALAIATDAACPVYVSVSAGVLTLTAKNKGSLGNAIPIEYSATSSCASLAIVDMASGATDPDVQDALDVAYPQSYNLIATPYNDTGSLQTLRDHLDDVSGPIEQRPCCAVFGFVGATADAMSLASSVNSGRVLGAMLKASRSLPMEIAAALGSVIAYEEDPAKPLNTLALDPISAPDMADELSRNEQESLLYAGITPLEAGLDGIVRIVRAVTTYLRDAMGLDDKSLLDITTIRTLDYTRKSVRSRVLGTFQRAKLSSKTPARIKSEIYDTLKRLEALEIVENVEDNADALIVERDDNDANRVNAAIPADVVNGLHVFAGRIDLIL